MALTMNEAAGGMESALAELTKTTESLAQVRDYCAAVYAEKSGPDTYTGTQKYASDALQNVVYHVHNVAIQLDNYIDVQLKEISSLELQTKVLASRLKNCHGVIGELDKHAMLAPLEYITDIPMTTLQEDRLPLSAQPLQAWTRQRPREDVECLLNVDVLDNVGLGTPGPYTPSDSSYDQDS